MTDSNRIDAVCGLWSATEAWYEVSDYDEFIRTARGMWRAIAKERGDNVDPHWLYRLFDENDRLLYVGITRNLEARLSAHERRFGDLFDHYTAEEYLDRKSVLNAETQAIHSEFPAFNVVHPENLRV